MSIDKWKQTSKEELISIIRQLDHENQVYKEEVEQKNDLIKVIQEHAQVAWWCKRQGTEETTFSNNWPKMFNITNNDADEYLAIVHSEDRGLVVQHISRLTHGAKESSCKYRITRTSGEIRYMTCYAHKIGQKIYNIMQDITEQMHYKKSLEKSEEIYKQVVDIQEDLICRFKPDTTLTFVNKAYADFLQESEEALIGRKFLDFLPPETHKRILQQHRKAAQGKKDPHNIQRVEMHGQVYWHRWKDYPVFNESGKLIEFQSVGIDVTDKVLMQQKLEESERKYRLLTDASSDIIYQWDRDMNLKYVSPAISRILGYSEDELLELSFERITTPENLKLVEDAINYRKEQERKGVQENGVKTWHFSLLHKEGYPVHFETNSAPIRNEYGEFFGVIGIARDISDRVNYEKKLIRTNEALHQLIDEKNRFISTVSHELKSPLNAILGMTDLLTHKITPIPYEEILATLSFAAKHLNSLVNNLLDLAGLHGKYIRLESRRFNLFQLFRNCTNYFLLQSKDKQIDFRCHYPVQSNLYLYGDPDRLAQIINNLVSNAIKFTDKGYISVSLSITPASSNTSTIAFRVRDTGQGIPPEYVDRVFEPFVRVRQRENKVKKGSGIGLAVVKELVNLHQGKIELDSEEGVGTTVTVELSLPHATESDPKQKKSAKNKLSDAKILYVEDLEYNRKLMEAYAVHWGFQLTMVASAEECLLLLKTTSFDLILMDIMLPDMQGDEATLLIREMEKSGTIPSDQKIIALTAPTHENSFFTSRGFDDVVSKPIVPRVLLSKIKKWTDIVVYDPKGEGIQKATTGYNLFDNFRTDFKEKQYNYKIVLTTFKKDLQVQQQLFEDAILSNNNKSYSKVRHNSMAMLAMLNEQKFRNILEDNEQMPFSKAEKSKHLQQIKLHIENICIKIEEEINSLC